MLELRLLEAVGAAHIGSEADDVLAHPVQRLLVGDGDDGGVVGDLLLDLRVQRVLRSIAAAGAYAESAGVGSGFDGDGVERAASASTERCKGRQGVDLAEVAYVEVRCIRARTDCALTVTHHIVSQRRSCSVRRV